MPRAHPIHTYTLTYVHISNSRPSRCKDLATTGGAPPPVIGLGTSLSKPSWHHSPPRTFCQSIEFHDHDKLNYHSPAPLASALSFFYLLLFEDIGQRSYRIVRSPALPPVTQLNSYHRTVRIRALFFFPQSIFLSFPSSFLSFRVAPSFFLGPPSSPFRADAGHSQSVSQSVSQSISRGPSIDCPLSRSTPTTHRHDSRPSFYSPTEPTPLSWRSPSRVPTRVPCDNRERNEKHVQHNMICLI